MLARRSIQANFSLCAWDFCHLVLRLAETGGLRVCYTVQPSGFDVLI